MSDHSQSPPRTTILRWTRVYGSCLRETYPVESDISDDLTNLLEQADRRRPEPEPQNGN